MNTIYTGLGAIDYVTVTVTAGADISHDTVQLSVGSYNAPSTWVTPDALTFSTDGKTATAKVLIGNGHINPVAGQYWVWYRVVDSPTVKIQPVRSTHFKVTDTAGVELPTLPPFVQSVTGTGVNNTDPANPVVTGGGGSGVDQTARDAAAAAAATAAGKYTKPGTGIPASDLATGVVKSVGTTTGTVAAGDDSRFLNIAPAPGPTYNLLPQYLPNLRRAIGRVRTGTGSGNIVCVGDSTTGGQGVSQTKSYPTQLAGLLNTYFIPAAQTWVTATTIANGDPRVTLGSHWSNFINFMYSNGSNVSDSITIAPSSGGMNGPTSVNTFDIYTVNGTFTATTDDGSTTTWTAGGGPGYAPTKTTLTCPASASRVLTITSSNGYFCSVNAYDTTKPVMQIMNLGVSGSQSSNWSTTIASPDSHYSHAFWASNYPADLTIADLGVNDAGNVVSPSTFQTNMTQVLAQGQAVGDVILKTFVPSGATPHITNEPALLTVLRTLGTANNVPVVDVNARWQSYAFSNPLGYYSDTLHPSAFGYADDAEAVFCAIKTL